MTLSCTPGPQESNQAGPHTKYLGDYVCGYALDLVDWYVGVTPGWSHCVGGWGGEGTPHMVPVGIGGLALGLGAKESDRSLQ